MKISVLLAGMAVAVTLAPAFASAQTAQDDKVEQLGKRVGALEAQAAQAHASSNPAPVLSGWWNNTSISGRAYFDVSDIAQKSNGAKTAENGASFDLKRFYIGIDHTFGDMFAADITTDATYDSTTGTSQIFIKKAYLQMKLDPALTFRFGSADMPWIPYADGVYGFRYLEKSIIDRTNFGTSADWGVHALGSVLGGIVNYDFAAVNGGSYKKIPSGGGTNRVKQLDYEGRVSLVYDGFNLAVGGYTGKLGQPYGVTTYHTAQRFNALAAYVADGLRIGVEYFNANDWTAVTKPAPDSAHGWSGYASWYFLPQFAVFGRYEDVVPNGKTVPLLQNHYYNFGVAWEPTKIVDLALTYKHEDASHGTLTTANGVIGGSTSGAYNEIGIFGGLQF